MVVPPDATGDVDVTWQFGGFDGGVYVVVLW
jgi:hypothetical protein